jgi:hypothetical protein
LQYKHDGPLLCGMSDDQTKSFETVWALSGRLRALGVFHSKSALCGVFAWAREPLNSQKRRCLARAVQHFKHAASFNYIGNLVFRIAHNFVFAPRPGPLWAFKWP